MIIPVRCWTCGKLLADKWVAYERRVRELKEAEGLPPNQISVFDGKSAAPTPEKRALDELHVTRYCCTRIMLTSCNLIGKI